jgi:hypothetical protein
MAANSDAQALSYAVAQLLEPMPYRGVEVHGSKYGPRRVTSSRERKAKNNHCAVAHEADYVAVIGRNIPLHDCMKPGK